MVIGVGILLVTFFMTGDDAGVHRNLPQGFNIPLPLPTMFLIGVSKLFTTVLVAAGGWKACWPIVILFKRFQSSKAGGRKLDGWQKRHRSSGQVVRVNLFGQFARTLGTLLQSSVPVLTALKITEQVMSNVHIKEAIAGRRVRR